MTKILITGSAGLIGSALQRALAQLGIEVVGLDHKVDRQGKDYGDILDHSRVLKKMEGVVGVVHLAAVSRVIFGEKDPKLCWKINVEGTQSVLEGALSAPQKPWVIYGSSREVYGEPSSLPVPESAPLRPINIYGESKLRGEECMQAAMQKGLQGSIVRFSSVFGSVRDHKGRVIPTFCRSAATGAPLRIDGRENVFDFTYIDDVIQGLLAVIDKLRRSIDSPPPIHFVSGAGVSLGEAAFYAQERSDYSIEIVEGPARLFDVSKFVGDQARAKELLHWKACIDARTGMHRLINQFRLAEDNAPLDSAYVLDTT